MNLALCISHDFRYTYMPRFSNVEFASVKYNWTNADVSGTGLDHLRSLYLNNKEKFCLGVSFCSILVGEPRRQTLLCLISNECEMQQVRVQNTDASRM